MIAIATALSLLAGGQIDLPKNLMGKRGTVNVRIGRDPGLCSGRVETLAAIGYNGAGDYADLETNDEQKFIELNPRISAPYRYDAGWDPRHFVGQSSNSDCWAAVLAMLANRVGLKYEKKQFIDTLRAACGNKINDFATSNQVVYAFTKTLGLEGSWIGDLDGALREEARNSPSLFEGIAQTLGSLALGSRLPPTAAVPGVQSGTSFETITWNRTFPDKRVIDEAIYPIYFTADLVAHISQKHPVVAGLGSKKSGHVVLVTSVIARPGGFKASAAAPMEQEPKWKTKIESVGFVDPGNKGEIEWMNGDEFIRQARFMFASQLM